MGVVESYRYSVLKIIPLTADLTRSRVSSTDHMWLHVCRACGQRTVRRRCSAHTGRPLAWKASWNAWAFLLFLTSRC